MTQSVNKLYRVIAPITAAILLSSCANMNKKTSYDSPLQEDSRARVSNSNGTQGVVESAPKSPDNMTKLDGIEFKITQDSIGSREVPELSNQKELKIAVEKMPLPDFIHYTFGKLLGLNYVMNESLLADKSEVSLKIEDVISKQRLYNLVSTLLSDKKLTIDFDGDVLFIKEKSSNSQDELVAFGYGNNVEDVPTIGDKIVQMVPLEFAEQGRIARVLRQLIKVQFLYDPDSNSLVFTGPYSQVRRAVAITRSLDIPSAKTQHISIFNLTFISPDEFISIVSELLLKDGMKVSTSNDGAISFTKLPHINSIVVHAVNEQVLERLEMWRKQLDVAGDTDESKFFVYHSKFADVEDLGDSLAQILALRNQNAAFATANRRASSNSGASGSSRANAAGAGGSASSSGQGISSSNVAVDNKRNTLTFYMTPAEYQNLLPIIEQLDVQAKQVVIEVTLMEVTLTGRLAYGIEWFITNSTDKFGTLDGLGGVGSGLTYTLDKPGLDILFNLRESENLVNIISNPKLMVTDGESALINIGTDIPVLSGVVESESGSITQNVAIRSTGVTLNIGVQVASGNQVNLDVDQQLSEAGENELTSVDSPVVLKRQLQTKVTANSGQTIMLAGLISENDSGIETQVPVLGDIPILGKLFETNTKTKVRTELVILITPRVVESESDLESITEALSSVYQKLEF